MMRVDFVLGPGALCKNDHRGSRDKLDWQQLGIERKVNQTITNAKQSNENQTFIDLARQPIRPR
jgi:hypothetical protein